MPINLIKTNQSVLNKVSIAPKVAKGNKNTWQEIHKGYQERIGVMSSLEKLKKLLQNKKSKIKKKIKRQHLQIHENLLFQQLSGKIARNKNHILCKKLDYFVVFFCFF